MAGPRLVCAQACIIRHRLCPPRTVTEKGEQAVVSKEARVKEELVVKKDVDQRTETVSDTVRRTEVKVDDERSSAASKARKRN
jgi:stress response protein YsnF